MNKAIKTVVTIACWASVAGIPFAIGCGQKSPPPPSTTPPASSAVAMPAAPSGAAAPATGGAGAAAGTKRARVKIATTSDGGINGTATFTATGGSVDVELALDKAPAGQHAWHIHEGTSCGREKLADGGMGAPGTAAGPHWNPTKMAHGLPNAKAHHAGDFGNFTADPSGKVTTKLTASGFNLDETGEQSAIGHAMIIHGGVDDGQGTNGDAGARIGCGIIEKQ